MKYEKVIDKIKKLISLMENNSSEGEVAAAKRALDALCAQYNIDLETLFEEKRSERCFKLPYNDKNALEILIHCYSKVTNKKTMHCRHDKYFRTVLVDLTELEYIELKSMFEFYFDQFKKEKRELTKNLFTAFVNKHDLFAEDEESDPTPMTSERLRRIMALQNQLEDVSYHKQLE